MWLKRARQVNCQFHWMAWKYPTCWHAIEWSSLLRVRQLQTAPGIQLTWIMLSRWQRRRKSMLSLPRWYTPRLCFLGSNMHVMTQALEEEDEPHLPHGLSVMNTYTEMATGSKWIVAVVKNLTTALITIVKGVNIAWVIVVNAMPQVVVLSGMLEKLDEMQGIQRTKMSVEHRKEMLFLQLDLSPLKGWSSKTWAATHTLLAKYHDIFSLESG